MSATHVTRVPVPVETLAEAGTTNAYLVGSHPAILVDPAGETAQLDAAVNSHGVGDILVTHSHPDHIAGVAAYTERTSATLWALAGRADRFEQMTGQRPDRLFRPGTTLTAGDGTDIAIFDTPGHAVDHVSMAVMGDSGATEGILTGDLVVAEGSVVVGADDGDMRAYLTSLRRLHARNPPTLYPGHGPSIEDSRAAIERLIQHRLRRENRVRAAVDAGAETPEEILDTAYEKDLSGVREYARSTVITHLEKLAVEGSIEWDGLRASPGH